MINSPFSIPENPTLIQAPMRAQNDPTMGNTPTANAPGAKQQYSTPEEAAARQALEQLKSLRQQMDAGQIKVSDFVTQGKQLANEFDKNMTALGNGGSAKATVANQLLNEFQTSGIGLKLNGATAKPGDDNRVQIDLPQEYQQRIREELLPSNISDEEKQAILKDIPNDIGYDTDRFKAEQEGVRERIQQDQQATDEAAKRAQYRSDLAGILSKENDRQFSLATPGILEDLQGRGLLNTSEVGNALAQKKQELQGAMDNELAQQTLTDENSVLPLYRQALQTQQNFQQSGIQRNFSLDDFLRSTQAAIDIGKATQPQQPQGKSPGAQVATGIAQGAAQAGASTAVKAKA